MIILHQTMYVSKIRLIVTVDCSYSRSGRYLNGVYLRCKFPAIDWEDICLAQRV